MKNIFSILSLFVFILLVKFIANSSNCEYDFYAECTDGTSNKGCVKTSVLKEIPCFVDNCYDYQGYAECNYEEHVNYIEYCSCKSCREGYYISGGNCFKCSDPNCKTCSGTNTNCLNCYNGYYLSSSKTCIKCNSPCKTCSSESECNSCNNNYFILSGNCFQCNIGCKTTSDNCKCDTCYDNYFKKNINAKNVQIHIAKHAQIKLIIV